jgi:DNA topoisomerase I
MSKSLVIVESPAKAKTINRYLGSGYTVKASLGHVMDLPKKELGVDLDNNFKPKYILIPSRKDTIQALKAAAKGTDSIYLAADPDREGEAICSHLRELLDSRRVKFYRVLFNEITREAIREAFNHPQEIDARLVDAQQARRVLDRLVGYQVSPLLWDKVKRGISAGRVQTVALRLIVEREREIQAFMPKESWTIHALLEAGQPPIFEAKLLKFKDEDGEIQNEAEAQRITGELEKAAWRVRAFTQRDRRRNAFPPFITSTLQQEAGNKLGFSAKKTMTLAQRLYEGVDLGEEGPVALITYMRTDSVRISPAALAQVRDFIPKRFGADHLPDAPNVYKSKKGAQDAHEAIRPTDVTRTPEELARSLDKDSLRLYALIWRRFVGSQMVPAIYDQKTIEIAAGDYSFRATSSVLKFDGWLAAYPEARNEKEEEQGGVLPPVVEGEALRLHELRREQHFTQPPPRYTEASLVKTLEEKGIGRPSTYATILSVIQNRAYVEKEKRSFRPTELGMVVNDLLVKSFSDIFDVAYTARMEEELDEVEEGKLTWTEALAEFYTKFKKDLRLAEREMHDVKGEGIPTDVQCEKCGKPMVIRLGRNGQFLACTGYPDCDATSDLPPSLAAKYGSAAPPAPEVPEQTCEKCGKPMALKRGRFGYFMACTGYPECRNTKKIIIKEGTATAVSDILLDETCPECGNKLAKKHGRYGEFIACSNYPHCKFVKRETLGIPCPEKGCTGEIVARRTKRRRVFYGCTRYPECKFTVWDKPVAEPCPDCGSPLLLEKFDKRSGSSSRYCRNEACHYERALA